jgi:DNA-binding IclR family transcriptional regulator
LGIALQLLDASAEGLRHGELCEKLGASKANVSHHLNALEKAGVIRRHDSLIRLADARHLSRLLRRNKPVPDLVARFAEAWHSLYRR